MTRSIQKWSDEADARLHDCFASTDWDMFCYSSNRIVEFTTSVINKCIDDIVHTVTILMYPNIKPWVTGNISAGLKARVTAYKEREKRTHTSKRYNLQPDIKQEK